MKAIKATIKPWKPREYLVSTLVKGNIQCTLKLELPASLEQTRHYENWVSCLMDLGYSLERELGQ